MSKSNPASSPADSLADFERARELNLFDLRAQFQREFIDEARALGVRPDRLLGCDGIIAEIKKLEDAGVRQIGPHEAAAYRKHFHGSAAAEGDEKNREDDLPLGHVPLIGWEAIRKALGLTLGESTWRAIRAYNAQTKGPIKTGTKGKRPSCYKDELLAWYGTFLENAGRLNPRDEDPKDPRKEHDSILNDAITLADRKSVELVANDFELTRLGSPNMRTRLRKKRREKVRGKANPPAGKR